MHNVIIIYSDKQGADGVKDWNRLVDICENDKAISSGPLIFINYNRDSINIIRSDNTNVIDSSTGIIYIQESHAQEIKEFAAKKENVNSIVDCVSKLIQMKACIYLLIHDNASVNRCQDTFDSDTRYGIIIKELLSNRIKTDKICILPFWHQSTGSKWNLLWPQIKNCIDELTSYRVENNGHNGAIKALDEFTVYLDKCKNDVVDEVSQQELNSYLLNLAAYDLYRQSSVSNKELESRILQAAKDSLASLKQLYPEDTNLSVLCLSEDYSPEFHGSLKRISSSLVKSYG